MRPIQGQKFHLVITSPHRPNRPPTGQPINRQFRNCYLVRKAVAIVPWQSIQPRYATADAIRRWKVLEKHEDSTHDIMKGTVFSSFRKVSDHLKNELPKCGCYHYCWNSACRSLQYSATQRWEGTIFAISLVCHFHQVTHSSATNATASPWHSQVTCIPQAKKICANSYRHNPPVVVPKTLQKCPISAPGREGSGVMALPSFYSSTIESQIRFPLKEIYSIISMFQSANSIYNRWTHDEHYKILSKKTDF